MTLTFNRILIQDGKNLVRTMDGKLIDEYSNDLCESYFYLLNDQRIVNIPISIEACIYEPYDAFIAHMEESHISKKISNYPRKQIKHLPDGRRIEFYFVNQEELKYLSLEMKILDRTKNAFLLNDGRVLINNLNSGNLYQNIEDYEAILKFRDDYYGLLRHKQNGEFKGFLWGELCGANPYGVDFPNHVDELVATLPEIINVPASALDFKFGNLPEVDKYLYKNIMTAEFQEKAFLPLLAYIGKTYIQQKGGHWEMLYDEACKHWLPDVRQADGELKMLYYPLSQIFDPWEGKGHYIPLRAVFGHVGSNPQEF